MSLQPVQVSTRREKRHSVTNGRSGMAQGDGSQGLRVMALPAHGTVEQVSLATSLEPLFQVVLEIRLLSVSAVQRMQFSD